MVEQLDKKLMPFQHVAGIIAPPAGWIKAIRTALGMTLQQLANKHGISKQSVLEMERREKEGTITLNTLRDLAQSMDLKLVYGFVPADGSLDLMIERKAKELARSIVLRTSVTMQLEDQKNADERIQKSISERAEYLMREMPKSLWD
jgi:predicted DNA-binding mobile mystery protein A